MNVIGRDMHLGLSLPLPRCPYCGVAKPHLVSFSKPAQSAGENGLRLWQLFRCTSCANLVLAAGVLGQQSGNARVEYVYPGVRAAADELPEAARKFLQQAYETLHAPDAAAVMAGSAVDAMLKEKGYGEGSLYSRIDKAVADHVLTNEMGDWAHWVRLGSNRPRHADRDKPHVSPEEARLSVEFAEALGQFLFVLSSRIAKGIKDASADGK